MLLAEEQSFLPGSGGPGGVDTEGPGGSDGPGGGGSSGGTSDNILWPLADHLGSVRDLIDSGGKRREHRVYDSFGNVTTEIDYDSAQVVISSSSAEAVDSEIGYTGREWDDDVGLQYNRARWYDPAQGRWISQDPIGFNAGDANLYRYVGNGVLTRTDPSGLDWTIGGLTPGQWGYATGVMFYEWGANGYRAGRSLVTGEAGKHLGERAVLLSQNESGNQFDGDAGDWGRFSVNLAQEMVGANAIAEGIVGVDAAHYRKLDGWERGTRIATGTGAMAGTAAGGFGLAGKCGVGTGFRPIPGTPNIPTMPLPNFMRRPLFRRKGTLAAAEEAEVAVILQEYETTVDIVGSRPWGRGRNVHTDFPNGKGPRTRSDIDFRIDTNHPALPYLIQELEGVNGGVGSASLRHSLNHRATFPPFFRLNGSGTIYVGPNFGAGGFSTGIHGCAGVNSIDEYEY